MITPERFEEIKRIQKACGPGLLSNIIKELITEVELLQVKVESEQYSDPFEAFGMSWDEVIGPSMESD